MWSWGRPQNALIMEALCWTEDLRPACMGHPLWNCRSEGQMGVFYQTGFPEQLAWGAHAGARPPLTATANIRRALISPRAGGEEGPAGSRDDAEAQKGGRSGTVRE